MKKMTIIGLTLVAILVGGYIGAQKYASGLAGEKIDKALVGLAKHAEVEYESVNVNLLNQSVRLSNVVVTPAKTKEKVNIKEIIISDIDKDSKVPSFLDISCKGVKYAEKRVGKDSGRMKELGYDENLTFDFATKYHYDKKAKEINIEKLKMGAQNAGHLDISLKLGNVDLSPEKMKDALGTYPKFILHNAKIGFNDDSLIERLMVLMAKNQKKTVAQIKDEGIQNIEKQIEKEEDEFIKNALLEIKSFMKDPKKITISINPENPMPIGRAFTAGAPKDIIKLLNVKIKS
ncbi:MAG: hypothetical protein HQK83_03035 [Fibrobacteria bacterium]|nr:hypothetical protein [Fibrobacteria bacterium]